MRLYDQRHTGVSLVARRPSGRVPRGSPGERLRPTDAVPGLPFLGSDVLITILFAWALLGVGCVPPDIDVRADLELSEAMPTVVIVQWEVVLDEVEAALVKFGTDREYGRKARAWIGDDGVARAVLVGMKPSTRYHVQVVEVVGADWNFGPDERIRTGSLATELPDLDVSWFDAEAAHEGYLVTSVLTQPSTAVIIDDEGDYVWAHQPDLGWDRWFIPRARLSEVGEWVSYLAETTIGSGGGDAEERAIVRVALDGSWEDAVRVDHAHHDFAELTDGTIAVLMKDRRTVDGELVEGDRLVELGASGEPVTIWSVWDHFEYDPETEYGEPGTGWTHANALDHEADDDAYYVSLRNLDTIVKIDRAAGDVLWCLGGETSDFLLPDGSSTLFQRQHQFEILDDGVLVFDNGTAERYASRVVEYRLDEEAGTAEPLWEYEADPSLYSLALGDVSRLPSESTMITWSTLGRVDEVSPEGEVLWRLEGDLGGGLGYTTWREALAEVKEEVGELEMLAAPMTW